MKRPVRFPSEVFSSVTWGQTTKNSGKWTDEEILKLLIGVQCYPNLDLNKIASIVETRTRKQVCDALHHKKHKARIDALLRKLRDLPIKSRKVDFHFQYDLGEENQEIVKELWVAWHCFEENPCMRSQICNHVFNQANCQIRRIQLIQAIRESARTREDKNILSFRNQVLNMM
ncbi:hypothetical protein ACHAXS_002299 [Conticribra weissflogii]